MKSQNRIYFGICFDVKSLYRIWKLTSLFIGSHHFNTANLKDIKITLDIGIKIIV